jgi:ABC-type multidrug transport system fused ATPase/permease subunit
VLVRFLPADAGEATLDGLPMERLAADDVRRVVGLVEQSPHLFDTTLAENLRVGRRSATDADLEAVLGRVGLGPWLAGLPHGLATAVGRRGGRLSGGQRQRVAVARALLADFPILVLDEPGEHLEPPAADALTADLLTLTAGRSTLFITHRLTGLEQVDEIVVLDAGQVAERGTHDELLVAGGRYADLWWEERLNDRPDPTVRPAAPVLGEERATAIIDDTHRRSDSQ